MKSAIFIILDHCDLDIQSGHMAYCHAALINLYLQTKFRSNGKLCERTDGRTYGLRTDVRTDRCMPRLALLGRLRRFDLKTCLRMTDPRRLLEDVSAFTDAQCIASDGGQRVMCGVLSSIFSYFAM